MSFFIIEKLISVNQNLLFVSPNPHFNKPAKKNCPAERATQNSLSPKGLPSDTDADSSATLVGMALQDERLPGMKNIGRLSRLKNDVHLRTKVTYIEHFFS